MGHPPLMNGGQVSFLGTPMGRIEMFNPATYGTYSNGCVLVGPSVPPGPNIPFGVPQCP